jgi:hypothetical protein
VKCRSGVDFDPRSCNYLSRLPFLCVVSDLNPIVECINLRCKTKVPKVDDGGKISIPLAKTVTNVRAPGNPSTEPDDVLYPLDNVC